MSCNSAIHVANQTPIEITTTAGTCTVDVISGVVEKE